MKIPAPGEELRGWLVVAFTAIMAIASAAAIYSAHVAEQLLEQRTTLVAGGRQEGHDLIQDAEIGTLKAWQEAHDRETKPLIAEFLSTMRPMAAEWPDLRREVADIHRFLAIRMQMPTEHPERVPPGYDVWPAEGCPSTLAPGTTIPATGLIAGELSQRSP